MRRIVTIPVFAALLSGLPLVEALARDGYDLRPGYYVAPGYYAAPSNPYAAWRSYYTAQAERSYAVRAGRANYFVVRGYHYAPPRYNYARPTNYYAEAYSHAPYAYFTCPLARRGEGVSCLWPHL